MDDPRPRILIIGPASRSSATAPRRCCGTESARGPNARSVLFGPGTKPSDSMVVSPFRRFRGRGELTRVEQRRDLAGGGRDQRGRPASRARTPRSPRRTPRPATPRRSAQPRGRTPGRSSPTASSEQALPPLDPELSKPLEPIDRFARRPAARPRRRRPPRAAAGPLPPPPLRRSRLTAPLPPLSSFDVSRAAARAAARSRTTSAPEPVRYHARPRGLGRDRARRPLQRASRRSTTPTARRSTAPMVAARAEGGRVCSPSACSAPKAIMTRPRSRRSSNCPTSRAGCASPSPPRPAARYDFGAIAIEGAETVPAGLARDCLPLKTGDPIVAPAVEAGEANIRLRLPQQGYPFADLGLRDILLDPATHVGDYTLPVDPGPRSRFAGFTTEGNLAFDAKHVGVLARFKRGDLYDSRKVDDLREAMVATGLFRTVSAEPVRTGETAPRRHRICQHPASARTRGRRARSPAPPATTPARASALEAAWEHQQPVPARRRASRHRASPAPRSRGCASRFRATIGASATAPCCSRSRPAAAELRRLSRAISRGSTASSRANRRRSGRRDGPMPMAPRSLATNENENGIPAQSRSPTPISSAG